MNTFQNGDIQRFQSIVVSFILLMNFFSSNSFIQLQQFQFPVNKTQNPGYNDIIVNPINLSKIENNIDNLVYTNSEAFLSDIKWILHNCTIYFSGGHINDFYKSYPKAFVNIFFLVKSYFVPFQITTK